MTLCHVENIKTQILVFTYQFKDLKQEQSFAFLTAIIKSEDKAQNRILLETQPLLFSL